MPSSKVFSTMQYKEVQPMKKLIVIALILLAFVSGYLVGQYDTITNASLHNITADGYQLNFNGQIHDYN